MRSGDLATNDRNIIITGFMGTGKTTVGRQLATLLGYDFVDTDEMIVQRNGRSVADIFREQGESFFRGQEAQIAQELATQEGVVIATGGRLMLDPHNAEALRQHVGKFLQRTKGTKPAAIDAAAPEKKSECNESPEQKDDWLDEERFPAELHQE